MAPPVKRNPTKMEHPSLRKGKLKDGGRFAIFLAGDSRTRVNVRS